jgi:hypothetical protein
VEDVLAGEIRQQRTDRFRDPRLLARALDARALELVPGAAVLFGRLHTVRRYASSE